MGSKSDFGAHVEPFSNPGGSEVGSSSDFEALLSRREARAVILKALSSELSPGKSFESAAAVRLDPAIEY